MQLQAVSYAAPILDSAAIPDGARLARLHLGVLALILAVLCGFEKSYRPCSSLVQNVTGDYYSCISVLRRQLLIFTLER